jgi:NAD(P)-dependent dehydrogenase (short-subunit alcohol dehydrogenase family)
MPADIGRSIFIVGASRGLGQAMAAEFARRGWGVLGTVRAAGTPLHGLAAERPRSVEIETLDMTDHDQMLALRDRLFWGSCAPSKLLAPLPDRAA